MVIIMKMVIKEIDEQGRIVIPIEWREEEGLSVRSKVELVKDEGKITIKPLKYKSLMDLQGIVKGKTTLEEIENAEAEAAHKRFKKTKRKGR